MKPASWYAVKNVTNDQAEISIFDEIGLWGISSKQFAKELKSLGNRRVLVRINSPGGEIFEGNAIYNALRRHPGGVDVAIDALAASMASVIAMVGENRSMAENGMFMIHNPWTVSFGESKDMRKSADLLDDLKENIVSAYAGRTGMKREELSEMMDEETWLTAAECKEFGFIDKITEPLQAYNSFERFDISKFTKRPTNFMATKEEAKIELKPEAKTATSALAVETVTVTAVAPEAQVIDLEARISAIEAGQKAEIEAIKAAHKVEIEVRDHKISDLQGQLGRANESLERLEKSLGVAAARIAPAIAQSEGQKSIVEQYNALTDPAERSRFYDKHKDELSRSINQPAR